MALPIEFITRTRALLGEEYDKLEAALQADVPVSIRINRNKGTKAPSTPQVGWSETGYYLPERLSFTFDPIMCRKPPPCFWSKPSGTLSANR